MKHKHYKIYIGEGTFLIIHSEDKKYISAQRDQQVVKKYKGKKNRVLKFIEKLEKQQLTRVVFHTTDVNKLWKKFKTYYKQVPAAGGIVINPKGKILFIFRRGMWDIPKGKIDKGEARQAAAIREVREETGVKNLHIVRKIASTYHTYGSNSRKLKQTHWYLMRSNQKKLVAQKEEGIEKCEWLTMKQFVDVKRPIYISILEVLQKYHLLNILPEKLFEKL